MSTYIWVSFWLLCLGVGLRLLCVAFLSYPRIVSYKRWEDVLRVVVSVGFAIWAWAVLQTP